MSGIDLQLKNDSGGDTTSFIPNGEWHLIGTIHYDMRVIRPIVRSKVGEWSAASLIYKTIFSLKTLKTCKLLQFSRLLVYFIHIFSSFERIFDYFVQIPFISDNRSRRLSAIISSATALVVSPCQSVV